MVTGNKDYTAEEIIKRAQAHARIKDQQLVHKTFPYDGYICEMNIYNDNNAHIKFGKRAIFGWIDVHRVGGGRETRLGYSVVVDLNDWDLSPRYVEHGLLGKLDMFVNRDYINELREETKE